MASTRESVLEALAQAIRDAGIDVIRNSGLPERVPACGLVIVRDGDPGEPDRSLNPMTFYYSHLADVECYVRVPRASDGSGDLDALIVRVGSAIEASGLLGGLVEYLEPDAPISEPLPLQGAEPLLGAFFGVRLEYLVTSPLTG